MGGSLSMRYRCGCIRPKAVSEELSTETPARLIIFDILVAPDGPVVIGEPLHQRRHRLEDFMAEAEIPKRFIISPATTDLAAAEAWLGDAGHGATDGVIAKELARGYEFRRTGDDQSEAAPHR